MYSSKVTNVFKIRNKIRDIRYIRLCGLVVRTADSYTCGRWFDSYLTYFFSSFCLFVFLELYVRVNKFSVMSGRFPLFIGLTSSKQWITCNSYCAGSESRTGISLSIPSLTLKWLFYLFFHWDCRICQCTCSPKIMFYMILHNNII